MFSKKRLHIIANVGDCTRPKEKVPCPAATLNAKHGVDLQGFNFAKARAERGGKMHYKFCVIDNQTIITGSYNWSDNAECKNDENISIQADPQQATKYSVEFRNLRTQTKK